MDGGNTLLQAGRLVISVQYGIVWFYGREEIILGQLIVGELYLLIEIISANSNHEKICIIFDKDIKNISIFQNK